MDLNVTMPNVDFDALPPVKKYLLLFAPAVLIVALALVLLILPQFEEREKLAKELDQQRKAIDDAKLKTARLDQLIADNTRLKKKLDDLQYQLPQENEVSTLLRMASERGIESGLIINSWKPGNRTVHSSKDVYEIPVDVTMLGSYHNLGKFYSELTKLSRIVNLSNIVMTLKGQQRSSADLDIKFAAVTYSVIPEAERKALQEAEKKQEAGKKK
jgi:type IV pilus assembly protein PilO